MKWKKVFGVRPNHKIFESEGGRLAIADMSGSNPSVTEDGILWVDEERPCKLHLKEYEPGASASVPLVDEKGRKSHTISDTSTAVFLSGRLGMDFIFEIEGMVFSFLERGPREDEMVDAIADVVHSADDEGCDGDLTVASKSAIEKLKKFIKI